MNKVAAFLIFSLLFCALSNAQEVNDSTSTTEKTPKVKKERVNVNYKGFSIGANAGVAYHSCFGIRNEFKDVFEGISETSDYQKFNDYGIGRKIGINGMTILDGSLIVGGDISNITLSSQTVNKLEIGIQSNTAMINIGAILSGTRDEIIYSYFGFGLGQYIMELTNNSSDSIAYDYTTAIAVNSSQKYKSKFNSFEIGVGYKKFIGKSLCFGAEMAAYVSTTKNSSWTRKDQDEEVLNRYSPQFYGGYVRLYVAFGKINHTSKSAKFD